MECTDKKTMLNQLQLSDLTIIKEIGSGGFGQVVLVKMVDKDFKKACRLPEQMAMKKVFMGKQVSNQQKQNVMKEVTFLKKLNSPLFIHVYHSFFEQNEHGSWYFCILMEYAQKGDLLRYFIHSARETNTVIEEAEIWRICKAVAKGLSILHSRNIVHKDIKPQNILVMSDLSVKIADMGISVSVANLATHSMSVSKVGTPLYTSPEVIKRQPFDFKIDIWSLGCLLHYMACLQPPFMVTTEDPLEDTRAKQSRERRQRMRRKSSPFVIQNPAGSRSPYRGQNQQLSKRQVLDQIIVNEQQQVIPQEFYSSNLQGVISRCLEKNPIQRPSADEILLLIPSNFKRHEYKSNNTSNRSSKSRLSKTTSNFTRVRNSQTEIQVKTNQEAHTQEQTRENVNLSSTTQKLAEQVRIEQKVGSFQVPRKSHQEQEQIQQHPGPITVNEQSLLNLADAHASESNSVKNSFNLQQMLEKQKERLKNMNGKTTTPSVFITSPQRLMRGSNMTPATQTGQKSESKADKKFQIENIQKTLQGLFVAN